MDRPTEPSDSSNDPEDDNAKGVQMGIEEITGKSYLERNSRIKRALRCPHPHFPSSFISGLDSGLSVIDPVLPCEHVFGRAYDLRRHLLSEHGLAVEKDIVDAWAEGQRKSVFAEAAEGGEA